MNKTVNTEHVICSRCKGLGVTSHSELRCYHNNTDWDWTETCTACNGSGIIQVVTTTIVERTPWVPLKEDRTKR